MHDLQKYFQRMPTHVRVTAANSWNRLKETLEGLPKMLSNLPPMKLTELPKMNAAMPPLLPDQFNFIDEDPSDLPEIVGSVCEEGLFNTNIKVGIDVVVYTKAHVGRPWVGRMIEILENNQFVIYWFNRLG